MPVTLLVRLSDSVVLSVSVREVQVAGFPSSRVLVRVCGSSAATCLIRSIYNAPTNS